MVECERGTIVELLGSPNIVEFTIIVESAKSTIIVESTERALTGQEAGAQGPQSASTSKWGSARFATIGTQFLFLVFPLLLNLLKLELASLKIS